MSDAGEYSCTIAKGKTCKASLTVEKPKVSFLEKPDDTIFGDLGSDAKISVKLSRENVQVQWLKNEEKISSSSKYVIESSGAYHSLTIKNGSVEDIAHYTCIAENVRMQTDLELKGADDQIDFNREDLKTDIITTKGQDVTLKVPFKKTAIQKPEVSFKFNGQEVAQKSERVTKYRYLKIVQFLRIQRSNFKQ